MNAAPAVLLLYRNEDTLLEQAFRLAVPPSIDTLAELCRYITEALPPPSDSTGKGYRFLYSIAGKPLWRVKECLDAANIIVSTGPGFLARRTVGTTEALSSAQDVTPAAVSATFTRGATDMTPASQSPPAHQPDQTYTYGLPGGGGALGYSGSEPGRMSIQVSQSPYAGVPDSDAGAYRASVGEHATSWAPATDVSAGGGAAAGETFPTPSPAAAPPPVDGEEGQRVVGGYQRTSPADSAEQNARSPPPSKRLFESDGNSVEKYRPRNADAATADGRRTLGSAPTYEPQRAAVPSSAVSYYSRADAARPLRPDAVRSTAVPAPAQRVGDSQSTLSGRPSRGDVVIDGVSRPLPPRVQFPLASSLLPRPEEQLEDDSTTLSGMRVFAARKWKGFSGLNALPPTDVLASNVVDFRVQEHLLKGNWPLRVVVNGPPGSGVSTVAALALRSVISSSSRSGPLHNHLVLPLDCNLLFGDPASLDSELGGSAVLLDIASAFQIVVRAVMDAVAVQRPFLRAKGLLLAQLWDKLVTSNTQSPPDFSVYPQVTAAVGHQVVEQWERFARLAFPILQAARRTGVNEGGSALRDAAIDLIFYALPCELAASLRFSGMIYALDGLHILAQSHQRRRERPTGDLDVLLKCIWADSRCHIIAAWPHEIPVTSVYLQPPTRAGGAALQLRTVGLVPTDAASKAQLTSSVATPPLPDVLECNGQHYPLSMFLGCPGYLASVARLTKPLVRPPVATSAFSSFSQMRKREEAAERFRLRVDDADVGRLLQQLSQLVAAAQ